MQSNNFHSVDNQSSTLTRVHMDNSAKWYRDVEITLALCTVLLYTLCTRHTIRQSGTDHIGRAQTGGDSVKVRSHRMCCAAVPRGAGHNMPQNAAMHRNMPHTLTYLYQTQVNTWRRAAPQRIRCE